MRTEKYLGGVMAFLAAGLVGVSLAQEEGNCSTYIMSSLSLFIDTHN